MTRKRVTLAELAEACGGEIRTGPFGSQLHKADYVDDENATPVVMPTNMIDGRIDVASIARIDAEACDRLSQHVLSAGDIVLARRGDIGRRAWVGHAESGWLCGTGSMRISLRSSPQIRARYLYYYLATDAATGWLEGHAVGATMANLSAGVVGQLPVELPEVAEQDAVVGILDSIAQLIENNRRRIEILEEMARLIYREWFVQFRFSGHEDVELVGSGLGLIPEGWNQGPIGSVLSLHIGGGWGQEQPAGDETHPAAVIRGTDIPGARNVVLSSVPKRYHKLSTMERRRLRPGDLVMEVSGGSKGQPVGRTLLVTDRILSELDGSAICASFCKLLRFDESLAPEIGYFALRDLYDSGLIDRFQVQSTGITNLKFKAFLEQFYMRIPSPRVQEAFLDLIRPIISLSQTLGSQNRVIAEARNLLLPRLISGELDVSDLDLEYVG